VSTKPHHAPQGPYFHGTRAVLQVGEALTTGCVSYDDSRQMCWATTSVDLAFFWAYQRETHVGEVLYVYEVELELVLVDPNVPRSDDAGEIDSVMSPSGRVVRLIEQMHESEHPTA